MNVNVNYAMRMSSRVHPANERFSITEISREFSVTARTLRFYENEGLISPQRNGGIRSYSRADRARLAWILRGRSVGFSLAEIRELLDMYAPGAARRDQMAATVRKCEERVGQLLLQRAAIDETIKEINMLCDSIHAQLNEMEKD